MSRTLPCRRPGSGRSVLSNASLTWGIEGSPFRVAASVSNGASLLFHCGPLWTIVDHCGQRFVTHTLRALYVKRLGPPFVEPQRVVAKPSKNRARILVENYAHP